MKKVIRLTESDLVRLVKRVINEQPITPITKITNLFKAFSESGRDDLVRLYGQHAKNGIIRAIDILAQNPKNYVVKNGITYAKSISGAEIEIAVLNDAINSVMKGYNNIDDVIQLFPNRLADGSEFREYFSKMIRSKPSIYSKIKTGTRVDHHYLDPRYVDWSLVSKTSPSGISNKIELNKAISQTLKDGDVSRLPTNGFDYWNLGYFRDYIRKYVGASKTKSNPDKGTWEIIIGN